MVSAYNDYRFRGLSLSDRRPVGMLDISYDDSSGLYAALSGSVVASRDEGLRSLGIILNGGYAKHVSRSLTADFGAVHSRYSSYSGVVGGRSYTEIYAGLEGRSVGARLSMSPNYFGAARATLYGEVNGHAEVSRNLVLEGHLGLLAPLSSDRYLSYSSSVDGRLGISQRIGPVSLHAALTGRTGSARSYSLRGHGRMALIVGISMPF